MKKRRRRKPSSSLRKNLRALARVDPGLAERVALPAGDQHMRRSAGQTELRVRQTWCQLEPTPAELDALVPRGDDGGDGLLFGLGTGVVLEHLLQKRPDVRWRVWERDPWLLRLALERLDLGRQIEGGGIQLLLGVDILRLTEAPAVVVRHPVLATVYRNEIDLLQRRPRQPIALVRDGGLFVDDMVEALHDHGHGVYTFDPEVLSREEIGHTIKASGALLLATINYRHLLAELCHEEGIRLVCWEIDPSAELPEKCRTPTRHARVFTYRRANVARFEDAGFDHVEHLPLAASIRRRRPLPLSEDDLRRYRGPVSFVGNSIAADAERCLGQFVQHYVEWRGGDRAEALEELRGKLGLALVKQQEDLDRYVLPEHLETQLGEFLDAMRRDQPHVDFAMLAAQSPASQRRLELVAALAPFGVQVWGDEAWAGLGERGVRYAGRSADHGDELSKIFQASAINVDIGRIYQLDIVTMRVFDVLACGGFLIAEHCAELEELFEIGVELESFRSRAELVDKVSHYGDHPERRAAIAAAGRRAVVERHDLSDRFARVFAPSHDAAELALATT